MKKEFLIDGNNFPLILIMKEVKYRVLIKSEKNYFRLGTILLQTYEGDIYYIPSQRLMLITSVNGKVKKEVIDHISWHKSGRVHFKILGGFRDVLEYGEQEEKSGSRQAIKDIGFQEIVKEIILDFTKLPLLTKKKKALDVILDSKQYKNPIQFIFLIVSGRLIVAQIEGKKTGIRITTGKARGRILDIQNRCLGWESDNADKLLQYILIEYAGKDDLKVNRRLFVPRGSKISRTIVSPKPN